MSEIHALTAGLDLLRGAMEEPKPQPKRIGGVIAQVCDTCGLALDSDGHINHCNG